MLLECCRKGPGGIREYGGNGGRQDEGGMAMYMSEC